MNFRKIIPAMALLFFTAGASAQNFRFHADSTFRIMQFTDLHYTDKPEQSDHIKTMIERVFSKEQPDLVIVTGDLIFSRPGVRLFPEICAAIAAQGVPYAIALGNHDSDYDLSREELYRMIRTLPGCVNASYNSPEERQGDFVIPILSADGSREQARLYLMDSNAYHPDGGYQGLTEEQVAWYTSQCGQAKQRNGYTSNGLLFIHVPLSEYREAYDNDPLTGFRLEKECPPHENTGMFRALVSGGEVTGVFAGHDHDNNYVARKEGIALVYGRYSGGFDVYQDLLSGVRMIGLRTDKRGFSTWERLASGREKRRTEVWVQ